MDPWRDFIFEYFKELHNNHSTIQLIVLKKNNFLNKSKFPTTIGTI